MGKSRLIAVGVATSLILVSLVFIYYASYPQEWLDTNDDPRVSWFDIRSGKWARFIKNTTNPSVFDGKYVVTNFEANEEGWIDKYGHEGITIFNRELNTMREMDTSSKPYTWGKIFITRISDVDVFIIPQLWVTRDRKLRVVPYLINKTDIDDPGFMVAFQDESYFLVLPILNWKDTETCLSYPRSSREYCSWWKTNRIFYKINLYVWKTKKEVPNLLGTHPAIPIRSLFYLEDEADD
jgi:hypothetical protein